MLEGVCSGQDKEIRRENLKKLGLVGLTVGLVIMTGALILGCAGPQGPAGPAGPPGSASSSNNITQAIIQASRGPLTAYQLAEIQPGLGTVMIEYGTRFDNLWFAAQKGNWNMAKYQTVEMTEIQEVAEITRPARKAPLKAYEDAYLTPLLKAIDAKDLTAFTTAYDNAIAGCNVCHAGSSSKDFPTYKFVKITRPTAPNFNNVDWAGQ